jgi:hypothetical protein
MSKAQRIRTISVFTSGGKFPVLTLSYINTALSQSAFRIYKCYIIKSDKTQLLANNSQYNIIIAKIYVSSCWSFDKYAKYLS